MNSIKSYLTQRKDDCLIIFSNLFLEATDKKFCDTVQNFGIPRIFLQFFLVILKFSLTSNSYREFITHFFTFSFWLTPMVSFNKHLIWNSIIRSHIISIHKLSSWYRRHRGRMTLNFRVTIFLITLTMTLISLT